MVCSLFFGDIDHLVTNKVSVQLHNAADIEKTGVTDEKNISSV